MSLPRVGARLLRKYEALPPETRVADVIATCFSDPALFPAARFAAEVTELARRDTLDYADRRPGGLDPDPHRRVLPRRKAHGLARRGPHHRARPWSSTAATTAWSTRGWRAGPRTRSPAARIVVLPRTGHVAHMEHPAQVAAEIGALLVGNSRRLRPVDAWNGPESKHQRPFSKKDLHGEQSCRCPLWWSPPKR